MYILIMYLLVVGHILYTIHSPPYHTYLLQDTSSRNQEFFLLATYYAWYVTFSAFQLCHVRARRTGAEPPSCLIPHCSA
jgi:hypothetical protein